LVIANLISPRVEYHDYGKTQLYFKQFAKNVVETVIKVCKGGGRDKQGRIVYHWPAADTNEQQEKENF
jgi:hypothetical protein